MNGDLKFGIELLKQGDTIGKHIARFGPGGKYEMLRARDYAVVDFRSMVNGKATNVKRQDRRITVFFSDNFDTAVYYEGNSGGEFILKP